MTVGIMGRMISEITNRLKDVERLCILYRVQRLDLFGSAVTTQYNAEESDLDFVVEFQPLPAGEYADTYFGLLESLEQLFDCPVDLIIGSAIKNPYFLQSVEKTRIPVYET